MVELIPKKEQKPIFGQVFFLIVSVAMLFSVAAAFFILQQLVGDTREVLDVLEKRFVQDARPLEEELSSQLKDSKKKTEVLGAVLGERKNIPAFFKLLEQTSHPNIVFDGLTGDVKTGSFLLTGMAQNFQVLEQQRLVWEKQEEFSAVLGDIQLEEGGRSTFEVEFTLKPEILNSP